ncbi:MAG: DUF1552 domain-containing protein, partial [Deltaproteobacteria bacterium]
NCSRSSNLSWRQSSRNSHHYSSGQQIPTIDDPFSAFQTAFGAVSSTGIGAANPTLRLNILDIVKAQVQDLQKTLGSAARTRLDFHLNTINQTQQVLAASTSSGCGSAAPTGAKLDGQLVANAGAVVDAHISLILSAFSCDVTRIASLQVGVNAEMFVSATGSHELHAEGVHGGYSAQGPILMTQAEQSLSTSFASLVTALKNAPDPLSPGESLLDNTLLFWSRDIGDGPTHKNFSTQMVLAGATDYLKTAPAGSYYHFGGSNDKSVLGPSHQSILVNLCEYMNVAYDDFGDPAGPRKPLTEIKIA